MYVQYRAIVCVCVLCPTLLSSSSLLAPSLKTVSVLWPISHHAMAPQWSYTTIMALHRFHGNYDILCFYMCSRLVFQQENMISCHMLSERERERESISFTLCRSRGVVSVSQRLLQGFWYVCDRSSVGPEISGDRRQAVSWDIWDGQVSDNNNLL